MQWKYCEFCGSTSVKKIELGSKMYKCPRCDWEGIPNESDIVTVNSKAKSHVQGRKWIKPGMPSEHVKQEGKENKPESQEKIVDKTKPALNRETAGVPKNQEILNRVKNKDYGDAEFM